MNYFPRIKVTPRAEYLMVGGEEAERSLAVTQKKFLGGQNKLSTALCSCNSKFLCLNFHLDKSGSFKKQVLSLTSGISIKDMSLSLTIFLSFYS